MAQQTYSTSQYSYDSSLKASCQALKAKSQLEACFLRSVCRVVRALSSTKSFLADLLSFGALPASASTNNCITKMGRRRRRKKLAESFSTCCNWRSVHVIPISERARSGLELSSMSRTYYDSTWNSVVVVSDDADGYLQWLEEKDSGGGGEDDDDASKIDRLAEKFIESCHEKFRLEKQESYRRYQEMLARSV
ncbi:hypothetical protein KSP40_PGU005797 [Platanthera guangdongensis]|uniref:Uncharacterized protein n=1 Tax=Platanthera guangdongensis TaxID=2320717 RepID=A0ABR2MGF5_9ASPA